VGPRAFLGLERGDKAQSLPLLPHCFIFELEWRGKELLVLAWCWRKVGELEEDLLELGGDNKGFHLLANHWRFIKIGMPNVYFC
jgi:hypothetical protein